MRRRQRLLVSMVGMALFAALAPTPAVADVATECADLLGFDSTITEAEFHNANDFYPPDGTPPVPSDFCRVAGIIAPTGDSEIAFEVWMPPQAEWNGRFMGVGNGAFAGSVVYGALVSALRRGYATASTDTGHGGGDSRDASWGLGHPEKVIDFAYRAVHEMTVKAKAIVDAFYGGGPAYSYFDGCSSGGRQGLKEAQFFPLDYDGIIVGAPANNWTLLRSGIMGHALFTLADSIPTPTGVIPGPSYIPPAKYELITDATLAACDAKDGVVDGVLDDPRRCSFNPRRLQCQPGTDALGCLTGKQVESARNIYDGVRFSNHQQVYPGMPRSSEIVWGGFHGGGPAGLQPQPTALSHFRYLVFGNEFWERRTFNPDTDVPLAQSVLAAQIDATDPDLRAFRDRGGKIIMWHGWLDQRMTAQNSIDYYESVFDFLHANERPRRIQPSADEFLRLFMAPGALHCRAGPGPAPQKRELLRALEDWVEDGIAPERITATRVTGDVVDRTRPLCPYPQVARWTGTGSTDDAANFVCVSETKRPLARGR